MSLLQAGASIFGSVLGAIGQHQANKTNIRLQREQNEWNAAQQEKANQWNLEQWQREAAYNSASAQMQRLREAGLNPNLMYGQGSPGSAGQVRTEPAQGNAPAKVNNTMAHIANNVIPAISMYQDLQNKQAQLSVQERQAKLIEQEITGKALENIAKTYANDYARERVGWHKNLAGYEHNIKMHQSDAAMYDAQRKQLELGILSQSSRDLIDKAHWVTRDVKQRALQGELDLELSRELKPFGMTTRDDLWQRKFVPLLESYISKLLSSGEAKTLYQLFKH